jgi:N-acetylmuramoyl-L-alanine amidase
VGHFTINGTGSGTFGGRSTYSISESVSAAPQLLRSWTGNFNETIHVDDLLSDPDGRVIAHYTDDEKLLQGPITGNVKPPPGVPGLPGAGLSVDARACTFQFMFDPSFDSSIGTYGFIGLQPSGSLAISMGTIQGPLPTNGLVIAGSASVSGFSALIGAPGTWTVSWDFEPAKFIVVIDPGHGAIQAEDGNFYYQRPPTVPYGLFEDNLTLSMANVVVDQLQGKYGVYQTRPGAQAPFARKGCGNIQSGGYTDKQACLKDIDKRLELAEKWGASVLVSIHTNADDDPTTHGTTTFYGLTSFHTATLCTDLLNDVAATTLRSKGCKHEVPSNILKSQRFPSSLVEVAFHSNSKLAADEIVTDLDRLNDPVFLHSAGHAIANAIDDFITNVLKGGQQP